MIDGFFIGKRFFPYKEGQKGVVVNGRFVPYPKKTKKESQQDEFSEMHEEIKRILKQR